MIKNQNYSLLSLKDLLENFYISEISETLNINYDKIKYINSSNVLIEGFPIDEYSNKISFKEIKKKAEQRAKRFLETFTCKKNEDVENFIHNLSIDFQKRNKTRTYLIISEDSTIMAYFSLAIKPVFIEKNELSSKNRKISNSAKVIDSEYVIINTFLIGQLARDNSFNSNDINLDVILGYIFDKINDVKDLIGGTNILIEIDNESKLVDLYKKYGFEYLQHDESNLSQLWQLSINY